MDVVVDNWVIVDNWTIGDSWTVLVDTEVVVIVLLACQYVHYAVECSFLGRGCKLTREAGRM